MRKNVENFHSNVCGGDLLWNFPNFHQHHHSHEMKVYLSTIKGVSTVNIDV